MKRYSDDYGLGWHGTAFALRSKSPTTRRPLTRQEAARVICQPLPKRTSDHASPIVTLAVAIAILVAWALAFLVAFQTW